MESKGKSCIQASQGRGNRKTIRNQGCSPLPAPNPHPKCLCFCCTRLNNTAVKWNLQSQSPQNCPGVLSFSLSQTIIPQAEAPAFLKRCFITSPSSNLSIPGNKDGGKSNTTSPLAVGMTCLIKDGTLPEWQDRFKRLSLSHAWVGSKMCSQNSEPEALLVVLFWVDCFKVLETHLGHPAFRVLPFSLV